MTEKTIDPMTLAVARFVARVAYRLNRESIEQICREATGDHEFSRAQPDEYSLAIARNLLDGWDMRELYEREVKRRTDNLEQRMYDQKQCVIRALKYLQEARVSVGHFDRATEETRKLAIELGVPGSHI